MKLSLVDADALSTRILAAIERQQPAVREAIFALIKAEKIGTRIFEGDRGMVLVNLAAKDAPDTAAGIPLLITDLRSDELMVHTIPADDVRLN